MPDIVKLEVALSEKGPWQSHLATEYGRQNEVWFRLTAQLEQEERLYVGFPFVDGESPYAKELGQNSFLTIADWVDGDIKVAGSSVPVDDKKDKSMKGVWSCRLSKGEVLFRFKPGGAIQHRHISSSDFTVFKRELKDDRFVSKELCSAIVTLTEPVKVVVPPPVIIDFYADKPIITRGEDTVLKWQVSGARSVKVIDMANEIFKATNDVDIKAGECRVAKLETHTKYQLVCYADEACKVSAVAEVTVFAYGSTVVKTMGGQDGSTINWVDKQRDGVLEFTSHDFNPHKLMGLYVLNQLMYALVLHDDDSNEKRNVLMWESRDGLKWRKCNHDGRVPAFTSFGTENKRMPKEKQVGKHTVKEVDVPLAAAGYSGVIFQNKLYLLGGSRFNDNIRSNKVYHYDFDKANYGWYEDAAATYMNTQNVEVPIAERAMAACVVYKDKIWMTGGMNGRGEMDDIYTYTGTQWAKVEHTKFRKKSRHALVVADDKLQIYGGEEERLPVKITEAYQLDGTWEKMSFPKAVINMAAPVSCAAANCNGKLFLFLKTIGEKEQANIYILGRNNTLIDTMVAYNFTTTKYVSIQATAFGNAVWLCILSQHSEVYSERLQYFYYCR